MEKRRKLEYQLQVKNLLLEQGRELTQFWSRQSFIELFFKYRVFSHDVTAAILVSQNNETAAMLVSQTSLVGVNSFLMQTFSFVLINLHRCWPRE